MTDRKLAAIIAVWLVIRRPAAATGMGKRPGVRPHVL